MRYNFNVFFTSSSHKSTWNWLGHPGPTVNHDEELFEQHLDAVAFDIA